MISFCQHFSDWGGFWWFNVTLYLLLFQRVGVCISCSCRNVSGNHFNAFTSLFQVPLQRTPCQLYLGNNKKRGKESMCGGAVRACKIPVMRWTVNKGGAMFHSKAGLMCSWYERTCVCCQWKLLEYWIIDAHRDYDDVCVIETPRHAWLRTMQVLLQCGIKGLPGCRGMNVDQVTNAGVKAFPNTSNEVVTLGLTWNLNYTKVL